jgi:hypothetical protein
VDEGDSKNLPSLKVTFPKIESHHVGDSGDYWYWPGKVAGLIESMTQPRTRFNYLNPNYIADAMKAFKLLGVKCVEVHLGCKKREDECAGTVYRTASNDHPLMVTAIVMGMRV